MKIRALDAGDLEQVLSLVAGIPNAPQWPRHIYEEILDSHPEAAFSRFALVCETALPGEALAAIGVISLSRCEQLAELESVAVRPGMQRHGIGSALLRCLSDLAYRSDARRMRLEVRGTNAAALALYRSQGFREMGRRKSYYSAPGEDALIFEKLLERASLEDSKED